MTSSEIFFPARNPPAGCGAALVVAARERRARPLQPPRGDGGALSPRHRGQGGGNPVTSVTLHTAAAARLDTVTEARTRDTWHVTRGDPV